MQSATIRTNRTPRIERGVTKIYVPHEDGEIAFAYPSTGPGDYISVGKEILSRGQKVPTGSQTASLLHATYCNGSVSNEPEFQNIKKIMTDGYLWIFNRNLWTSKGVYVVHDLDAIGRSQSLNEKELERIVSQGKEIKGVIFGNGINFAGKDTYKLGEQDSHSLAKSGFMIASYGEEGANKLAEISSKFEKNSFVYGLNPDQRQNAAQGLSALYCYWFFGVGLVVVGNGMNDDVDGHSFGVCAPEKGK